MKSTTNNLTHLSNLINLIELDKSKNSYVLYMHSHPLMLEHEILNMWYSAINTICLVLSLNFDTLVDTRREIRTQWIIQLFDIDTKSYIKSINPLHPQLKPKYILKLKLYKNKELMSLFDTLWCDLKFDRSLIKTRCLWRYKYDLEFNEFNENLNENEKINENLNENFQTHPRETPEYLSILDKSTETLVRGFNKIQSKLKLHSNQIRGNQQINSSDLSDLSNSSNRNHLVHAEVKYYDTFFTHEELGIPADTPQICIPIESETPCSFHYTYIYPADPYFYYQQKSLNEIFMDSVRLAVIRSEKYHEKYYENFPFKFSLNGSNKLNELNESLNMLKISKYKSLNIINFDYPFILFITTIGLRLAQPHFLLKTTCDSEEYKFAIRNSEFFSMASNGLILCIPYIALLSLLSDLDFSFVEYKECKEYKECELISGSCFINPTQIPALVRLMHKYLHPYLGFSNFKGSIKVIKRYADTYYIFDTFDTIGDN